MIGNESYPNQRKKVNKEIAVSKEDVKADYLDSVSEKTKMEWHSQKVHKIAVAVWFLDLLEIEKQEDRDAAMAVWAKTPSSFGTNCSALGQALGREARPSKTEATFAGF